jgi:hypothetical protein
LLIGVGSALLLCVAAYFALSLGHAIENAPTAVQGRAIEGTWLFAVFVSVGSVGALLASLVRLARPARLTLTPRELIITPSFGLWRSVQWSAVDGFSVASVQAPSRMLSSPQRMTTIRWQRVPSGDYLAGIASDWNEDDSLPRQDFGMSQEALVALLNDYKDRATAAQRSASR